MVSALLVGGGAITATAEGRIAPIFGWNSEEKECDVILEVYTFSEQGQDVYEGDTPPTVPPYTAVEEQTVLKAAREFLTDYDYDAIDIDQAVKEFRADEAEAIAESAENLPGGGSAVGSR